MMKDFCKNVAKVSFVILFFISLFGCNNEDKDVYVFTGFHEPALDGMRLLYSYDGYKWDSVPGVLIVPHIGNDHQYFNIYTEQMEEPRFYPTPMMRDPSICQGPDGKFHLVWTIGWSGSKGFGYSESDDLMNWSEQRIITVMEDSLTNDVWAPEISYDEASQKYYIIWSSSIPQDRWTDADRLGSNIAHRLYYTTTTDFQTFAPTKLYYNPGFNSIDGFLAKFESSKYVFVLKDNRKPGYSNLFCVFSDSPDGPFSNPTTTFAPTYSEGPCMVKVGDDWLIYFDEYRNGTYGAVKTQDFQTFTPIDDEISVPSGHKHGTIFKIKESLLKKILEQQKQ